ncbi:uncharacterized protein LOC128246808 [Mya arenaria]|uniref:uncharacterized protein LOC128246808 n=1 Tax=Mya arenaria TaxID=6604 RepID=UPI0022E26B23|nr:uncharacterized protein LOC128246808 [Mya arenaria]
MLSVYATHGSMVDEETLKRHFRLLVKDKASLAIKAAVVVYENGNVADRVGKISVKSKDLKEFRRTFDVSEAETVRFNGVTYCVKDLSTNQIVAFNGAKYLIVTRTEVTYIVVVCISRQQCVTVASWVDRIARKLRERNI